MNLRRISIVAVLAAAAAGTFVAVRGHAPSAPHAPESALAAHAESPHAAWKHGTAYTYAMAWEDDSTIRMGAGRPGDRELPLVQGAASIRGELTLRAIGESAGAFVLAASLDHLEVARLSVMGSDPFSDPKVAADTFAGHEAFVEIDTRGGVRAIHFPNEAPELFAYVMRTLLAQLTLTLPGDARTEWTAMEDGPSGHASVTYAWSGGDSLTRTRVAYETLSALPPAVASKHIDELASTAFITVTSDGTLTSLDDRESLASRTSKEPGPPAYVATNAFTLRLLRTASFDASTQAAFDASKVRSWHPGDPVEVSDGTQQHVLAQLAGNVTLGSIEDELRVVGSGASVPNGFPTQAAAYLRLHPAACDELAHTFADDALGTRGRELVTDLLAAAGDARAQAALRTVLASADAKESPAYGRMLQRMSFVAAPAHENVELLTAVYTEANAAKRTKDARSAAYALGATAHNLVRGGDVHAAEETLARVERDLKNAKGADDKRALLGAIGNAGLAESESLVASYGEDEDPSVREAAADALRRVDTPSARTTLEGMLDDADANVGAKAVASLGEQPLSAADVGRVASLVAGGSTPSDIDARLVSLFGSHPGSPQAVLAAIDTMTAREQGDPKLLIRLQQLRAEVASR